MNFVTIEIKQIIKQLLLRQIRSLHRIKNEIPYTAVLQLWKTYRQSKSLVFDDAVVRNAFEFHDEYHANHVIMYYSKNADHCLLLCKVNQQYFQYLIPEENLKSFQSNFIAVYT